MLLFCCYNKTMQPTTAEKIVEKPLFDPTYLNIEYVFNKILEYIQPVIDFFTNAKTWEIIGIVSMLLSLIFITIIIFSLVRLREIQLFEKEEIDHEINHALAADKERDRNLNPKWHYVLTLVESPNESDWRVSIMEADSMLEELLKEKGMAGNTVSELLEQARSNGYASIQDAWEAHIIRNKIAHQGSDYPVSQVEARRVIRMFQNFFEELRVI